MRNGRKVYKIMKRRRVSKRGLVKGDKEELLFFNNCALFIL